MRTYEIRLNGKVYSSFVTSLRQPLKVLSAWHCRMTSMGYGLPSGDWSAQPYQRNSLDSYGN
jgi:hypothetical protein